MVAEEDGEFVFVDSNGLGDVDEVDDAPVNGNDDESQTNPFLSQQLSPSNMYHHTGEAGNSVNIKTFNANSRSNLFSETKRVVHRDAEEEDAVRSRRDLEVMQSKPETIAVNEFPKHVHLKTFQHANVLTPGQPTSILNEMETISSPQNHESLHPANPKQKSFALQTSHQSNQIHSHRRLIGENSA